MAVPKFLARWTRVPATDPPRRIRNLEMHLVHGCNLSCESCSHYSNQGHKGMLSLEEAADWMRPWGSRIHPVVFSLLGGEPTIHPQLPEFVVLARKHWPRSHLRLATNGFFLHRHPDLPSILKRDPDARIYLSIHHDAPEYQEKIRPIKELLEDWVRKHGIQVRYVESFQYWARTYKGVGTAMEPFDDGQPRQSWEHCLSRFCPQLFDGKIWKCPALAYLKMQDDKYHLSEKWKPYLRYQPLKPDCSNQELKEFFDRQEEPACGMCPANPESFKPALPMPIHPVRRANQTPAAAT